MPSAFRAKDAIEAQKWIDTEEDVRSDLAVLENEGHPLWDGETPIVVRAATFAEKAAWTRKSVELSEEEGDYNANDTLAFWSPSPTPPAPLTSHAPDLRTAHPDRGGLKTL